LSICPQTGTAGRGAGHIFVQHAPLFSFFFRQFCEKCGFFSLITRFTGTKPPLIPGVTGLFYPFSPPLSSTGAPKNDKLLQICFLWVIYTFFIFLWYDAQSELIVSLVPLFSGFRLSFCASDSAPMGTAPRKGPMDSSLNLE
jgi:hypothetical protein